MFVKTTDGIIVDIGVDVTPTSPIKEEMTYEERWAELKRQVKIEIDKSTECKDILIDLFDGTFDTGLLRSLHQAYSKVFITMEGLEKK